MLSCEFGERLASQESERPFSKIHEGPVPEKGNPEVINPILILYREMRIAEVICANTRASEGYLRMTATPEVTVVNRWDEKAVLRRDVAYLVAHGVLPGL